MCHFNSQTALAHPFPNLTLELRVLFQRTIELHSCVTQNRTHRAVRLSYQICIDGMDDQRRIRRILRKIELYLQLIPKTGEWSNVGQIRFPISSIILSDIWKDVFFRMVMCSRGGLASRTGQSMLLMSRTVDDAVPASAAKSCTLLSRWVSGVRTDSNNKPAVLRSERRKQTERLCLKRLRN